MNYPNNTTRRSLVAGLLACTTMTFATFAAADSFPSRPITLISPYQAGGSADGIARALATAASTHLGQPVVLEARPGAEGMIGSVEVMNAEPDGYTILWGGAGSMMVVTALRNTPPFDPFEDFTPIAGRVDFSFFLYTHPDLPVSNIGEFVEHVRENPGVYNYGTGNNQGVLSFAYLAREYDLDIEQIAYQGEMAVIADLLPGRVHAMFATPSALPHVREGNLNAIVTTLQQRSPLLPDVLTMEESGLEGVPFSPGGGWLGLFGPAGMDDAVVETLNAAFSLAFEDPEVIRAIENAGTTSTIMDVEDYREFVRTQRDSYIQVVNDLEIPKAD